MSANILYVEDDDTLAFLTHDAMKEEGYNVIHCADGQSALDAFKTNTVDICVVDVMMPIMDGFTLASRIRDLNSQIPIIFVTAKSLKEDKIKGLTIGADDYITKPFSIEELLLKVNIFLKRRFINDEAEVDTMIGRYEFDFKNLQLTAENEQINLTQREGELLQHLALNKNEIVSRKDLLERVWGKEDYFLGRSMDVFISRLRKHLSQDSTVKIENVHGVGFKLVDQLK